MAILRTVNERRCRLISLTIRHDELLYQKIIAGKIEAKRVRGRLHTTHIKKSYF